MEIAKEKMAVLKTEIRRLRDINDRDHGGDRESDECDGNEDI